VIPGLTEAQKIEYAWQVNMARRHLSKAQKRQLAEKLWREGKTQQRIAQRLGVTQPAIANWVREFIKSDKLPPPPLLRVKMGSTIRARKPSAAPLIQLSKRADLKPFSSPLTRVTD
jgi:transposase-like protein